MAFCKNCGAQVPDDVKFCTNCGNTLEPQMPAMNSSEPTPADNQTQPNVVQQPTYQQPNYSQSPFAQQPAVDPNMAQKTNGLAIAGFVISIVSMVCCCCGPLGILALIFSIVGFTQIKNNNQKGKGLAIAGIVISGIVVALWLISQILTMTGSVDYNYSEWVNNILEGADY